MEGNEREFTRDDFRAVAGERRREENAARRAGAAGRYARYVEAEAASHGKSRGGPDR